MIHSIVKYLVNESCEEAIANPKHVSVRDKVIDLEMTTTNDFIAEESSWTRFSIAWIVIIVQFYLFSCNSL
jgi:hypothetical protein